MEEDSLSNNSSTIKQFNEMSKGRCRDKFLAMKHVCGLSDLQYDILVEKFCSGRTGYTRQEIAFRHNVSERTLDRENMIQMEGKKKMDARSFGNGYGHEVTGKVFE